MSIKTKKDLLSKATEFSTKKAEMERLKKELEIMQEDFKKYLAKNELEEIEIDDFKISNISIKGKTTFDTKAFKEKHPKLYNEFLKVGADSKRFSFKVNE